MREVDPSIRQITLTFDNGPTPGVTDRVLDVLAERGAPATFFVVGTQLRRPGAVDLVRRAVAEGHRIGNHTATHTVLLGDTEDPDAAVQTEIAAMAGLLAGLDGTEKLFRPYAAGGILDQRVLSQPAVSYLQEHNYTCVLWNSLPHDWDDPDGWVQRALADVDRQAWTVVVLHDVDTGAMLHLPRFLDELAQRGTAITQDFPDSCLPIHRGQLRDHLRPLIKEASP